MAIHLSLAEVKKRLQRFVKDFKSAANEQQQASIFWTRFYECYGIRAEAVKKIYKNLDSIRFALFSLVFLLSNFAVADEYDYSSKQDELKETVIVEIGNVERLDLQNNKLEMRTSKVVLKLDRTCGVTTGFVDYWGFGKKAGMLVIDNLSHYKVAVFEKPSTTIKVIIYPVDIVDCGNIFGNDTLSGVQYLAKMKADAEKAKKDAELFRRQHDYYMKHKNLEQQELQLQIQQLQQAQEQLKLLKGN